MKFYTLIFAILFLFVCGVNTMAQMCGRYQVSLIVLDKQNKPVANAGVEFLPVTKDETRGKRFVRDEQNFSKFTIEYSEGESLKEFHKLIVSANGYKTAEMQFRFYSCRRLKMQVNLPLQTSPALPIWKPVNEVSFYLSSEDDRMLDGVKISVFKNGKFSKAIYSKAGGSGLNLDFGNYLFKLEKKDYQAEEIRLDLTKIENPTGLSRKLKRINIGLK